MLEFEKTYLAKNIPEGLAKCKSREIIDIYIPKSSDHPKLRLRKNGDKFEMTKKQPVGEDKSVQQEQTIILTKEEFEALSKLEGKRVSKLRYYYNYAGRVAEIDVFQEALKGLVIVDFEFSNEKEKNDFKRPEFCLDVLFGWRYFLHSVTHGFFNNSNISH